MTQAPGVRQTSPKRGTNRRRASQVAQMVKNLPAMQETQVQSLGWEDPLDAVLSTGIPHIPRLQCPMPATSLGAQAVKNPPAVQETQL